MAFSPSKLFAFRRNRATNHERYYTYELNADEVNEPLSRQQISLHAVQEGVKESLNEKEPIKSKREAKIDGWFLFFFFSFLFLFVQFGRKWSGEKRALIDANQVAGLDRIRLHSMCTGLTCSESFTPISGRLTCEKKLRHWLVFLPRCSSVFVRNGRTQWDVNEETSVDTWTE